VLNHLYRYMPVTRWVKRLRPARILEVGSGWQGMGPYVARNFVGCDPCLTSANRPRGKAFFMAPVSGSACDLPFKSATFDLVVCLDMLEHIPAPLRQQAVVELERVTRGTLILGFPQGRRWARWEERTAVWYQWTGRPVPEWLAEHFSLGLPSERFLPRVLKERGIPYRSVPNANNVLHFATNLLEASRLGPLVARLSRAVGHHPAYQAAAGVRKPLLSAVLRGLRLALPLTDLGHTLRRLYIIEKQRHSATSQNGNHERRTDPSDAPNGLRSDAMRQKIADYYESNDRMISSPFGGVGSAGRPSPYFQEVLDRLGIEPRDARVLEVGCGAGWLASMAGEMCRSYVGLDIARRSLELTRQVDSRVAQGDAQRLPVPAGRFSLLFCIDAFEHIPDQRAAAREFYRALAPGGTVFLSVPNYSNMAGVVKVASECSGRSPANTWAPFDGWQPQELERFMTPGRVRDIFRPAGFGRLHMIGGTRDFVDGVFPWTNRLPSLTQSRVRRVFGLFAAPAARLLPGLSLHTFWAIHKPGPDGA
jgi:ubiquinone/menaquinone biosynthesis C-methylase UbiE